jgi:carbonic anhydrase/acetyltransferase-like protein (isoleucine patch superfamily)
MTEPYAAHPVAGGPSGQHGAREDAGWVVFGAGGHARAVVDALERLGETVVAVVGEAGGHDWHLEVLADDAAGVARVQAGGLRAAVGIGSATARLRILGLLNEIRSGSLEQGGRSLEESAPSIGNSELSIAESARSMGSSARSTGSSELSIETSARSMGEVAPPVVAATATVARDAVLGAGTVVLEHAHVGPASRLGPGTIVNTGAIVEHDCTVGEAVHLAPGSVLLGGASVGARTLVGSGARVLPGVAVGCDVTVGAGAVVTRDVEDGLVVVGVPAVTASAAVGGAG